MVFLDEEDNVVDATGRLGGGRGRDPGGASRDLKVGGDEEPLFGLPQDRDRLARCEIGWWGEARRQKDRLDRIVFNHIVR